MPGQPAVPAQSAPTRAVQPVLAERAPAPVAAPAARPAAEPAAAPRARAPAPHPTEVCRGVPRSHAVQDNRRRNPWV
ncbi:hypothetical protein ACFV6D_14605, partial [Kitasatospora sp. NPDC059812]|uniref:hypothetical protein n=1 Tax=Kitasatospora sp. NPDC059812 TaxID=3346958 RepID=UPI003659C1A0